MCGVHIDKQNAVQSVTLQTRAGEKNTNSAHEWDSRVVEQETETDKM